MKIIEIPTNVIKPYFRNPRVNTKTVKALVEAIPLVGFNVPILVDSDYVIIKGHARWKAGRQLGLTALPCIVSENSDELNRLDRLADNKISELSEWDLEDLNLELSAINGVNITDFGFDALDGDMGWIEEPTFTTDGGMTGTPMISATPKGVERAVANLRGTGDFEETFLQLKCPDCGHEFQLSKGELTRLLQ